MIDGFDVSYANGTITSFAGQSFAFIRATYGLIRDTGWDGHYASCRKAGIVTGAYHFGVGNVNVAQQVTAFISTAHTADLLALDLESDPHPMSDAQAAEFIATVHARGRKIGLYHSRSGFPDLGQDWNWVAQWGSTPPTGIAWAFWQWTGTGLDRDHFNGDLAALHKLAGIAVPTYSLPSRTINGNPIRYAQMELAAAPPTSYLSARIQRRDHDSPPNMVYDWIGGNTLDGLFFQAGILQQATGPGGTAQCQAFAWLTRSTGIESVPGDPFPFTYRPLPIVNLGWATFTLTHSGSRWTVKVSGSLIAQGDADVLGSILVAHETWNPTPTGLAGAFQHVTTSAASLVVPPALYDGPAGGARSTTPGNVVLCDVGPSPTRSIVRW